MMLGYAWLLYHAKDKTDFSIFINESLFRVYKNKRCKGTFGKPTPHKVWTSNLLLLTVGSITDACISTYAHAYGVN